MFDPRSKNALITKYHIIAAESIDTFVKNRSIYSATESIDNPQEEKIAVSSLKQYLVAALYDILTDARAFFNDDPEVAYSELENLLSSSDIKEKVLKYVQRDKSRGIEGYEEESDVAKARAKALAEYYRALKKANGLSREFMMASQYVDEISTSIKEQFPDIVLTDTEE